MSSSSSDPTSSNFFFTSSFWTSAAVGRSFSFSALVLIVSCLMIALWYWILFHFDSEQQQQKKKLTTADDDDDDSIHQSRPTITTVISFVRNYKKQVSQQKKPKLLSVFLSTIVSPSFIFALVTFSILASWLASSIMMTKVFYHHEVNLQNQNQQQEKEKEAAMFTFTMAKSAIISLLTFIFAAIFYIGFIGFNAIPVFVQEGLSNGIIMQGAQVFLFGPYLLLSWFSEPLIFQTSSSSSSTKSPSNSLSIHPHPICANLQFASLFSSFFVLVIFILLFLRFEVRTVLEKDFPAMIETLERMFPDEIFPSPNSTTNNQNKGKKTSSDLKKNAEENKKQMIQIMKERKRR